MKVSWELVPSGGEQKLWLRHENGGYHPAEAFEEYLVEEIERLNALHAGCLVDVSVDKMTDDELGRAEDQAHREISAAISRADKAHRRLQDIRFKRFSREMTKPRKRTPRP